MANDHARSVAMACAVEAFHVAKAKGILVNLDVEKHVSTFNEKVSGARPSMLQDGAWWNICQILGWLGDIRNFAYSWRCTEKVGKVQGFYKAYMVRQEGEGEYHKSFNLAGFSGRSQLWDWQHQWCCCSWSCQGRSLRSCERNGVITGTSTRRGCSQKTPFGLMFHDNCHLSSTLCVTRGDIYNMSGAISANFWRNEALYHCTWKICLHWLWRRTLKEAKCEVEPRISWTFACQLRTSHPTLRSTFTLPRVSTMGGALACEVNGKSIPSLLPWKWTWHSISRKLLPFVIVNYL